MDYKIPDTIKKELFHGDFSSFIDNYLSMIDFSSVPGLKDLSFDEISNRFKSYIYLMYMQKDTVIEKILFMRLITSAEVTLKLIPMIRSFVNTYRTSVTSDEQLLSYVNGIKNFYSEIIDNCSTDKFKELSKKYDEGYLKEVEAFLNNQLIKMDTDVLLTLTKCVIINGMNKNYIVTVENAVSNAYTLFFKRKITFEEQKKSVNEAQILIGEINKILEVNGFTRS